MINTSGQACVCTLCTGVAELVEACRPVLEKLPEPSSPRIAVGYKLTLVYVPADAGGPLGPVRAELELIDGGHRP